MATQIFSPAIIGSLNISDNKTLKVNPAPVQGIKPVPGGSSQWVIAPGSPNGLRPTSTGATLTASADGLSSTINAQNATPGLLIVLWIYTYANGDQLIQEFDLIVAFASEAVVANGSIA